LPFRIFDSWAHEQDIRRAVDQPCDFSSPAGELSFARVVSALPYVVGKKVAPPDGTTVVFDVTGSRPMTIAIGVDGGRAKPLSTAPERATVTLAMDAQTLACLGLGRWDPAAALDDDQVTITGDEKLGRAVVGQMNFMFCLEGFATCGDPSKGRASLCLRSSSFLGRLLCGLLPLYSSAGVKRSPSRQGIRQRPRLRSWLGGSLALSPVGAGLRCAGNGSNQVVEPIVGSSSQEFFILM